KLGPQVWRAPLPFKIKFQATLHLLGYSVHLLLFLLTLIYPLVVRYTAVDPHFSMLFGLAYIFALTSIAPTFFFLVGQQQLGRNWKRLLPKILGVSVIGSGLMLNTVRAAWQIMQKQEAVFERTAKFGMGEQKEDWTAKRYQLRFDLLTYFELGLGLYSLRTAWLAIQLETWGILVYALLFGVGLISVAGVTIVQSTAVYRQRKAREIQKLAESQKWA
ncbi:MAG: hypothetical protein KAG66_09765, partial [Methylococcales bacterium]|nr:hypothetical protein [Methylococcales bacterium]